MKSKSKKEPVPPVDARKHYCAYTYVIRGGKMVLREQVANTGRDENATHVTKEEIMQAAVDRLSRSQNHHYAADGVVLFESYAIVKPKKIEVEIETISMVQS